MVELRTRTPSSHLIKADLLRRGLELANIIEAEIERASEHSGLALPDPVLSESASWARVWVRRGLRKYNQGDYVGALNNLQRAIQKQPNLVNAHNGLGSCYYKLKDYAKAAQSYRKALDLSSAPHIRCNLASALQHLNQLESAVHLYEQLLADAPRFGIAFYGLGVTLAKQARIDDAEQAFQQAVILMPDHAPSYYGLGLMYSRQRAVHKASEALKEAMLIDPIYVAAYQTFINRCEYDG
ncbi:MAG: tetratricopeptide repeat protein [Cyanobacteria bacterium P01_F01_bin.42]